MENVDMKTCECGKNTYGVCELCGSYICKSCSRLLEQCEIPFMKNTALIVNTKICEQCSDEMEAEDE